MRAVSIGFTRDDGEFELLATLNNSGDHLSDDDFGDLVNDVASTLCRRLVCQIEVLERNDAPDVVDLNPGVGGCAMCGAAYEDQVIKNNPRVWVEPDEQDLLNVYNQFTDSDGWTYEKAIIKMCKELNK